jgi:AraC-like DNA-binding protein
MSNPLVMMVVDESEMKPWEAIMCTMENQNGSGKTGRSWSKLDGLPWEELGAKAGYSSKRLARICYVSERQLARKFNEQFGCPPKVWLRECRLKAARGRLAGGGDLKEVAFELGFKQVSHFSRQFKERYRETPRAFLCEVKRKKREMSDPDTKTSDPDNESALTRKRLTKRMSGDEKGVC